MSADGPTVPHSRSLTLRVELSALLLVANGKLRTARKAFGPAVVGGPHNTLQPTMEYVWQQWKIFYSWYNSTHSRLSRTRLGPDFRPKYKTLIDLAIEIAQADTRTVDPEEGAQLQQKVADLNVARFELCTAVAFVIDREAVLPTVRVVFDALRGAIAQLPADVRSDNLNQSDGNLEATLIELERTGGDHQSVTEEEHASECEIRYQLCIFRVTTDGMRSHATAEENVTRNINWLCNSVKDINLAPEVEEELAERRSKWHPIARRFV